MGNTVIQPIQPDLSPFHTMQRALNSSTVRIHYSVNDRIGRVVQPSRMIRFPR